MPILIDRLPFGPIPPGAILPTPLGDPIPHLTDRIVLWASITDVHAIQLPPRSPIFPVVFDSGFNSDFLIQKRQFMSWTAQGVYEHCFYNGAYLRPPGEAIPLAEALVWIHPNRPGTWEVLPNGKPFCLSLSTGIAVTPPGSRYEKSIPLLGLSAIRFSEWRVRIDGKHETVAIEVP